MKYIIYTLIIIALYVDLIFSNRWPIYTILALIVREIYIHFRNNFR